MERGTPRTRGILRGSAIRQWALTMSADGRRALLEIRDLEVIDQPMWPAHDAATTPAIISYRVEWEATDERRAERAGHGEWHRSHSIP